MKTLPKEVLSFLLGQRASVLATALPLEKVHAAAMLYSCNPDPLEIYFFTESGTKKVEKLTETAHCHASLVIGTTEELKQTLQLSGTLYLVQKKNEIDKIKELHYAKFPQSKVYESDTTLFLKFIPDWWRHTNYSSRPPITTE